MRIESAGLSHVGMKRTHNEDNLFVMDEELLYLVADGMGGHSSGEIASQMAVETIANFFKSTSTDNEVTWPFKMEKDKGYNENRLITAIKLCNLRIFEAQQKEPRYRGMGTTCVAVQFAENQAYVAHVGDSRVYRVSQGKISQLTDDHSLLNDYIKAKKLTPEEIAAFPHKNVIVRALGMKDSVLVDIFTLTPDPGDVFVLCTDGLSGLISDDDILHIVLDNPNLNTACEKLIEAANKAGGTDNVSVILARCVD